METDVTLMLMNAIIKVLVMMFFVTAFVEVLKDLFHAGPFKMLWGLITRLWNGDTLPAEYIRFLTFLVALLTAYSFDFGVMSNIVEAGQKVREGLSGWVDYIGTSSVVAMGASWAFDTVVKLARLRAEAKKKLAETQG